MTVWKGVDEKFLYGIAKNSFTQDKPHRLSLDVGDAVIILKESSNWYYGYNKKNRGNRGIFPKSYIELIECVKSKNDYVIKRSEIVDEITTVLVEWGDLFKKFYLTNNKNFLPIRQKMLELIRLRSQILSGNLPVDEMKEVKLMATSEIDVGNSLLGLDMVVRNESGSAIDINSTSTTQLYELHMNAVERIRMASTSFNKNRVSKNMNKHSHNLLVRVHAFVCKFQEDSDLLITLYDADEQKSITENYVVKWGRQGLARDIDQFDNNRVLFTDLSTQDLNRNKVYLICYAIRIGGMDIKEPDPKRVSVASVVLQGGSSKKNSQNSLNFAGNDAMRRPFGVAAIDLTPIIKKPEDFKNNLDLPFILCEKENLDTTLKKLINNKDVGKIDSKLAVSVEVLHGDTKQIREEYPHLVHGNVPIARKMGFPEVIFPGDVRNDMYLTLVNGEFSKGLKSGDKNIEVMVCVCNEKGIVVPDVITLGAGYAMTSEYKSVIYYHEDKPKWNETFKVQVSIEEFKQCHLRFTFKHRSSNEAKDRAEKPFAISYVKLMQNDGTTLHHTSHKLLVYKIDQKKYDKDSPLSYLTLPSKVSDLEPNSKPSAVGLSLSSKDFFVIETNLCSTKLTQDVSLLGLLNWSSNLDALESSLNAIMGVKPEEVVKFLQDILDALFSILVQNSDPAKYDDLVFRCLLRLIEIVSEIKYQHFQSVLDLYINESFSATLAYDKLINVLLTHIRNAINSTPAVVQPEICSPSETEMEGLLYKITKNLQYIMKFIIRSRILFAELNDNKDRVFFEQSLDDLLTSFKNLIACRNNLLRSQGATLKYIHVIVSDLMQVYSPIRLSQFIVDIILNIPAGRLTQSKMMCIKDMIDSKLFKLQECRSIILPVFCQQIKEKLESKEEGDVMSEMWQQQKNLTKAAKVLGELKSNLHTRESTAKTKIAECVNIMNNILGLLHRQDIGSTVSDIRDIMFILLRTVIQSSIQMDRDNPLVGNLVAIMLGIFRSMRQEHYSWYVNHFATRYDLMDFLTEILHVFKDLVSYPVFPNDWMDMIMHQNIVILESLKHFTNIILEKFFVPFEKQVWSNFFHCSIAFLIQPSLQLDQFTENKTSTILLRYRDIRKETAIEIRKMWFSLGENKIQFVPQLVGPLLEMSLIPEPELRQATIPIFFDMMQAEYCSSRYIAESYGDTRRNNAHYKGNFNDFENEMIEKLDILVEGGRGDNEYKEMFYHIMTENCRNHNTLKVDGTNFVVIAAKLMERLLEYRCIINDESKENRMACTVSLLQFYSEVNRKEMYIRYVNKLCDLHMEFDNYTEAAFTLKLHSNLLMWNDTTLSSLLRSQRHPLCQTHRQLKEALYHEIIDYFDQGKMWESSLAMCKELAEQYEEKVFDYMSLSGIHRKMAEFYEKILKEMRHESEYFRVAFYGLKFPEFLRNKIFIYRGKEYERLSDFCTRILTQHPAAELMQTLTTPGHDITHSDGQYIQVNSVEPMMAEENEKYGEKIVAQQILKYYQTNNVQKFKFSRPYRDGKSTSGDSVANLWLERTVMKTTYPLPGILRWFPVESAETFKISPIEHAIETMEATNKSIRNLVIAHRDDETLPINPLSMKINGIVDPAVMGGFRKYEEAFLTDEYLEHNPDDVHFVVKLKELIAQQIPILEIAVYVHKAKAPKSLAPFHERLEKCFFEMQAKVEIKYGKRTSDLKFDREFVTMRRGMSAQMSLDSNRLSETSMGSNDSGLSKSMQPNRSQTSSIKSTFANFNFNAANLTRTSLGTTANSKKTKEKSTNKRRSSRKIDRESLNVTTSQWYTGTLTPIISTPPEKDTTSICSNGSSNLTTPTNSLVVELTEELTPKRPLRSEIERERRLSRTVSIATPTNSIKGFAGDSNSVSDEESNRNSIVTTDSTASDEDQLPPPLPAKTSRDSTDYSNLPTEEGNCGIASRHNIRSSGSNKPLPQLPIVVNVNYEYVEARNFCIGNDERKRPPTPPPKPTRNSKGVSSP